MVFDIKRLKYVTHEVDGGIETKKKHSTIDVDFMVENMLNLYLANDILPKTLMCFFLINNFVWHIKIWFY